MNPFTAVSNVWRIISVMTLFIFFVLTESQATHLRAGDIVAERVNCGRTFKITITVYTNTGSTVRFGGEQDIINFGDGSWEFVPQTENNPRPDLDAEGTVATASYTVFHTYPTTGTYVISYREPNRNEGVLNMDISVQTTFYLETVIKMDAFLGCNDTPVLLVPPIDHACPGVAWTHNPGAYDPDKDSLSYALVVPFSDRRTEVLNYRDPNDPKFYNNYNNANEEGTGKPTFSIDPVDGTITWDAPGAVGEYNIAFHVIEWRKRGGKYYQLGYVRRDMQILVDDCDNERPDLILPPDTCVVAGTVLNETILGIDPDNDDVKIEAFSEIFNFPAGQSPATYSPVPGVNDFQPSVPPAELKFQWNTECIHVKQQPYQVVFKITDNPENGPKLVTFKTWLITVVGPPPVWEDIQINTSNRSTSLEWDPYFCQNAERMQIWRKVDGSPFEPDNCETGMPDNLGYELLGEVPIKDDNQVPVTSYVDTNNGMGLAPGAKYCYRLVAIFPLQGGGESYVSKDTCIAPLPADVPIMTHVTVDKTDVSTGEIRVSWRSPFDANVTDFPRPYRYDLYRAVGFARGQDSVLVATINDDDTTFLDTGLNTEDNVYNYSVTAYAANDALIGSAFPASSVRLTAQSQVGRIQLNWSAFVPWSNQIQTVPNKHLIYRGPEGATESELVLIDEVDVLANGFMFVDEGQHGELADDQTYCYRIMTRGGYGNPAIDEPLENFSQIICAQIGDTIPPCKPTLLVQSLNCEDFLQNPDNCGTNIFENTIYWNRNEDDCDTDILGYRIYRGLSADGEFTLLQDVGIVADTFFIDKSVTSFAYCYRISAVDRSLNESELSDPICNDNCPYYELPNVFTPNGDGCNDLFSAYSDRNTGGEEGGCNISEEALTKCARFVEAVNVKIYNRWGQEVYAYEGSINDDDNSIYVDWDGKDKNGNQLSTGVYYYVAEVTFDIVSPDKTKIIKGWVHLIR
ncbi:gliding motility-associated C-terminal domain-containing protein [Chryseolinea sp. H1M3-3]|uniref:T9SS type B sorting domain-containing protein n=1 Tax=Chryseolinea sp. H1M3-3 TaxID=3034144 RepID=UPI0023ED36C4|nr:gliding motility-associated C-terminal domain-containing protein [Chryseolinea sp. H1M3-3]